MGDFLPLWVTDQLLCLLYLVGVTLPYLFTYVSPHIHTQRIDTAIGRYRHQRRCRDAKERKRIAEVERLRRIQQDTALLKRGLAAVYHNQPLCDNGSTSSEEDEEEEEEEEARREMQYDSNVSFIDESMKNDRATLEHYMSGIDSIIDLFDGQGSITSASAATTIMVHAPRGVNRKPGSVLRI